MNKLIRMMILGAAAVVMQLPVEAASNLDKARGITGHYKPDAGFGRYKGSDWDPESKEARRYLGPMDSAPSRIFVYKKNLPCTITRLEDLEDIVLDMHFNLEPMREVFVGASSSEIDEWLEKVNTLWYLRCFIHTVDGKSILRVYYNSDARVFAAFRNPDVKANLSGRERELLDVCAEWITDNIKPGMPNLLKFHKVHDALVDGCRYDIKYYTTEDMILDGRGRCCSYTSAAQLLLHMLRIDCRSVLSTPQMNHIWNIVDINGDWYHSDVTWDDPISSSGKDIKRYNYLLMSEKEMAMDHEWPDGHKYPRTPEINKINIFKRQLVRGNAYEPEEDDELSNPRDNESILEAVEAYWTDVIDEQSDKVVETAEPVVAPVVQPVEQVSRGVADQVKKQADTILPDKKKQDEDKYVEINGVEDLNHNLKVSCNKMDGPTLEFKLGDGCGSSATALEKADFHFYLKYWNFLYDEKKRTLELDAVHWPHVRLLSADKKRENEKKLTAKEKKALAECRKIAQTFGTIWKLDRQKVKDVYQYLINSVDYEAGESNLVELLKRNKSGSLGYSELMHVVLTFMDIPNIMVHGRTHTNVHGWNMMRRANGKWYHLSAALDDEEKNYSEHKFEYFLRCDDEVYESMAWDKDETYPTPVKDKKRAQKQGLLAPREKPRHAPEVEDRKLLPLP